MHFTDPAGWTHHLHVGNSEAIGFVALSFLVNIGLAVGAIWTGIRKHEHDNPEVMEPDTELRWDLKR
jgi:hypothetical protein